MALQSLEDLLIRELEDLYGAESRLLEALPGLAERCASDKLREALDELHHQTHFHRDRLQGIFEDLGRDPRARPCKAIEGLLDEGRELLREDVDPSVRDAALIAAAQRAEHYEIAGYGTARTYADMLGYEDASRSLQEILDEQSEINDLLTELAISEVNVDALRRVDVERPQE